jgi:hypothetical protein
MALKKCSPTLSVVTMATGNKSQLILWGVTLIHLQPKAIVPYWGSGFASMQWPLKAGK